MSAPYYQDEQITLWHGDALEVARELPDGAADCIVTSPPYFALRDYGTEGQYGLEESPQAYVETMRALFAELRRILADDGTLWLNLGDSYATTPRGNKPGDFSTSALTNPWRQDEVKRGAAKEYGLASKNLLGVPWRVAFALQDDGWILRNAIIWHKPNAMPESVTDRLSGRYEHVFMFSKQRSYWFDLDAIREEHTHDRRKSGLREGENSRTAGEAVPSTAWNHNRRGVQGCHENGRNPGDFWTIPTQPFSAAHFAVMPVQLAQRCIAAGCKPGGTVLDPFSGSGTTGLAAQRLGRKYIGIDINAEYLELSLKTRLRQQSLDFEGEAS